MTYPASPPASRLANIVQKSNLRDLLEVFSFEWRDKIADINNQWGVGEEVNFVIRVLADIVLQFGIIAGAVNNPSKGTSCCEQARPHDLQLEFHGIPVCQEKIISDERLGVSGPLPIQVFGGYDAGKRKTFWEGGITHFLPFFS